jgi:hypothetical protein
VAHLVEALCSSQKVAGTDSDEVTGIFNSPKPSSRSMALGSTHSLTEMGTRSLSVGKRRPVGKADNLTATCGPTV